MKLLYVLGILLGSMIMACNGIDPLYVISNEFGAELIDTKVGTVDRMICIRKRHSKESCRPSVSSFYVKNIMHPGQLQARWKAWNIVEIFLFGGEVAHCQKSVPETPYKIELRRIPESEGRGTSWSDDDFLAFSGIPDSCGEFNQIG